MKDPNENALQNLFEQMLRVIRAQQSGDLSAEIPLDDSLQEDHLDLVECFNNHTGNLRKLSEVVFYLKDELPRLMEGIKDVLQTIEKSTIRVLDNTDGILEQHDAIENTSDLLRRNQVINRVCSNRIDRINQAQGKARMFVFDIIQAQEFQEMTRKQTDTMVEELDRFKNHVLDLEQLFSLTNASTEGPSQDQAEEEQAAEPEKANQDLVDQLLAEFGL